MILQVIDKAVEVGADSSQYPSNWIFHSREKKPGKAFVDGLAPDFSIVSHGMIYKCLRFASLKLNFYAFWKPFNHNMNFENHSHILGLLLLYLHSYDSTLIYLCQSALSVFPSNFEMRFLT